MYKYYVRKMMEDPTSFWIAIHKRWGGRRGERGRGVEGEVS